MKDERNARREKNKQLGRIPSVFHTDHANVVRIETMDLNRIEPKHFRWWSEVTEGGSLLLHRPGESSLCKGPDGLSRNVEGRDHLILANNSEWEHHRARVRGIEQAILSGENDDEEAEALTVDKVPEDKLEPLPHDEGLAVTLNYEHKNQEHKFGGKQGGKGAEVQVQPSDGGCDAAADHGKGPFQTSIKNLAGDGKVVPNQGNWKTEVDALRQKQQ